jgi:hypothetical protein
MRHPREVRVQSEVNPVTQHPTPPQKRLVTFRWACPFSFHHIVQGKAPQTPCDDEADVAARWNEATGEGIRQVYGSRSWGGSLVQGVKRILRTDVRRCARRGGRSHMISGTSQAHCVRPEMDADLDGELDAGLEGRGHAQSLRGQRP